MHRSSSCNSPQKVSSTGHTLSVTLLEDLIDGATGESMSNETLLLKAVVLGRRLRSDQLETWARSELEGYDRTKPDSLPHYRGPIYMQATGHYSGPFGQQSTYPISPGDAPDQQTRNALFAIRLTHPIRELEDLGQPREDDRKPTVEWPPQHVGLWDALGEANKVPHPVGQRLFAASHTIPQSLIRGVLSVVRSTLLTLALDLQDVAPDAGESGGPTVESTAVAAALPNVIAHITGSNNHITVTGHGDIDQSLTIVAGDVDALISAAQKIGIDDAGALQELRDAAVAPPAERRSRLNDFVSAVKRGSVTIGAAVDTEVIADQLGNLITQFLG